MKLSLGILLAGALLAQSQPASSDLKSDALAYYLAPNDKITIRAPQAERLNGRTFRIQSDGFVDLPSVGRLHAGGLSVEALEQLVTKRLRKRLAGEAKVVILVMGVTARPPTVTK
jgi:protein involved in polysaccharide export with SLBB domain